jgi:hypothetical protein
MSILSQSAATYFRSRADGIVRLRLLVDVLELRILRRGNLTGFATLMLNFLIHTRILCLLSVQNCL